MTRRKDASGSERWIQHRVTQEEAGLTLQEILTGPLQISRRMIQRLTRSGGIRLNRRAAYLGRKVKAGDRVAVRAATAEESGLEPVPMELDVRHEDADLLVINKPPFLLVHPVAPHHDRTLAHGIAAHYRQQGLQAKVRPLHRLDRDTSGLLLVAKTPVAHQRLDRQLRGREMRREYLALVSGALAGERGVIEAAIGRDERHPHLRAVRPGGEEALTRFRVVERYADATLVELELETGRTHQIRVHMAHLGHPLLGDRQYGGRELPGLERQALHASRLAFLHPTTGEAMELVAPFPEDLERARRRLRGEDG